MDTPQFSSSARASGGATITVSIKTPGPKRVTVEVIEGDDFREAFGGSIIVTPEGAAYFPSCRRMSAEQLAEWIAGQTITLPTQAYVASRNGRLN